MIRYSVTFFLALITLTSKAQYDLIFSRDYYKAKQFQKSNKDSATFYFTRLAAYKRQELNDSLHKKLSDVYFKAYQRNFEKNDLKSAAENILSCIRISTDIRDTAMMIKSHNANAEIYRGIKNFEAALKESRTAIDLALKANKTNRLLYDAYITNSAIFIDARMKKGIDSSIYFLEKAIPLVMAAGDSSTLSQCYNNLAVNLQRKQNFSAAISYYNKALNIYLTKKNQYPILLCNSNIAQVMCDSKDYKNAIKQSYYTLGMFKGEENKSVNTDLQLSLARSYLHLNQPDSAEKYFERFFEGSFMLMQAEQNSTINELNTKYQTEEKEKDIAILKKNSELQEEESKRKQLLIYFFIGLTILLVATVYLAVKSYFNKKKANTIITLQKTEVEHQKHLVEEKQKEIIDSINYAKRIQFTLLAHEELLNKNLSEYFVFFQPKDIVSGDFYWSTVVEHTESSHKSGLFFLAVCDSTGHGVPGAFMSLLNTSFINEAITEKHIYDPALILNHARKRLISSVSKDGQRDGMDGILLCIDRTAGQITYSAANNNPILISENKIFDLAADKMPIGQGEKNESFTTHTVAYKHGDMLYLYTDGYADQFGGPKGKKFKYKPLNELLLANSNNPAKQQKENIVTVFENWKGALEQVDDVCIIGIRL